MGHAHYLNRGGRVLVSPYDTKDYDFVVELEDRFIRVNVKVASFDERTYQIANPGRNRKTTKRRHPDVYLVWLPNHHRFLELPGSFLEGYSSRRIPQHMIEGDSQR